MKNKLPLFITDYTHTPIGKIPLVTSKISCKDRLGSFSARWSQKRMSYKIDPGLYGIGNPDLNSPVFVTANYKMSFDLVRKNLAGLNGWIIVLNTRGINVWCAAGKGTFGTQELIDKINQLKLKTLVNHQKIIVPQLGAVGVSASQVKKQTGFSVIFGPVYARDIRDFINNGFKKNIKMKKVHFRVRDRFVLIPMEFIPALKKIFLLFIPFMLLNIIKGGNIISYSLYDFMYIFLGLTAGTILVPLLLPFIPGRSFALKGWIVGMLFLLLVFFNDQINIYQKITYSIIIPPLSSYFALNFTGSTTFTSLSGVLKELKYAQPLTYSLLILAIGFKILSTFIP